MQIVPILLKELEEEAKTTQRFFKLLKQEDFLWQPHEKSMNIMHLASHIAEMPGWIDLAINTNGIDFGAGTYKPTEAHTPEAVINLLRESVEKGRLALESIKNEDDLLQTWTLRKGEMILATMTKFESVRVAYNQTTHHRAQLGVYFRLLDIPVPPSYGPTADAPF